MLQTIKNLLLRHKILLIIVLILFTLTICWNVMIYSWSFKFISKMTWMSTTSIQSQVLFIKKKREIKIIKIILLFNVIWTVINRKESFISCIVKSLLHLSKYKLILNEESISKVKKACEIMSERRNDKQFVNKNILLNILIKYFSIANRSNVDFINEINFN